MTLAERLKEARTAAGLTQVDLAIASAVTHQYISKIEQNDAQSPAVDTISRIADALKCSPAWLMFGEPEPQNIKVDIEARIDLSPEQRKLIDNYDRASDEGKQTIDRVAHIEANNALLQALIKAMEEQS